MITNIFVYSENLDWKVKPEEVNLYILLFEPRRVKTGLRGFRPGLTQTDLCSYRKDWMHELMDLERRGIVISV